MKKMYSLLRSILAPIAVGWAITPALAHGISTLTPNNIQSRSTNNNGATKGTKSDTVTLRIDLAVLGTVTHTVEPGAYKVLLENKLPDAAYTVSVQLTNIPIPALALPTATNTSPDPKPGKHAKSADKCEALDLSVKNLRKADQEADVVPLSAAVKAELENGTCPNDSSIRAARAVLLRTRPIVDGTYTLKKGQQLTVTVTRQVGAEKRIWEHTFATLPQGSWQLSYGFSFIAPVFNKEEIFYAATQPTTGTGTNPTYRITKERESQRLRFAPSIFFTWVSTESQIKGHGWGLSGGLGFDFVNPTVFLGPTYTFHQNLKLTAGLVAHQQRVLLGRYKEGDIINDNLNASQLHEDRYRVNPFISLSLGFSQNPFERRSQSQP